MSAQHFNGDTIWDIMKWLLPLLWLIASFLITRILTAIDALHLKMDSFRSDMNQCIQTLNTAREQAYKEVYTMHTSTIERITRLETSMTRLQIIENKLDTVSELLSRQLAHLNARIDAVLDPKERATTPRPPTNDEEERSHA